MNISFETAESKAAKAPAAAGRETTAYRASDVSKQTEERSFALDISGTVMDNSAYPGHGRTAEEVRQQAGQEDVTAKHNYMAVMSNSMSDEDFARLQKDGFHPGSTDIETVVTIVDHIKAALIKGGTLVEGYTDAISGEKLADITGSQAFAHELKKQFEKYDVPLTEENIAAVKTGWQTLEEVEELPEGAYKYLIENDLEPTPRNLYLARFCAADDGSRQGKGYYAADSITGYYAKKPETIDYESLLPQMEKIIGQAGFSVNESTLANAVWLIEKGIPLDTETFTKLMQLREIQFPVKAESYLKAAAIAAADGHRPETADLSKTESNLEKAVELAAQVKELPEEAADIIEVKKLPFTLKNLLAAWDSLKSGRNGEGLQEAETLPEGNVSGRRLLQEVRLAMTAEANLKLLKSGYQIETAPIRELIEKLKEAESAYAKTLTRETEAEAAAEKKSLYEEALNILRGISVAPADILTDVRETDTLKTVSDYGKTRAQAYEKAGKTYEQLMTEPRSDLGDSIKKAFQNVDELLSEKNLEPTEENRRAVRILGYNGMELTDENIEQVKAADGLLTQVVEKMKPAAVLSMIREGVNPLTMPLAELKEYLNKGEDAAEEMEGFGRFLYKLEQKNGISEEERSAFVGIYRLVRQLEKGDDAAVGAVLETNAAFTLENLLAAHRSSKKGHMDYKVDDSFGGLEAKETGTPSIIEQIQKGYINTTKKLEEAVAAESEQALREEYDSRIFEEVRNAAGTEEAVLSHLMDYHCTVSADTLQAAAQLLNGSRNIWGRINKITEKEKSGEGETKKETAEEKTPFPEALSDRESALNAYGELTERTQKELENAVFFGKNSALDVKTMTAFYKQLGFMGGMAREENYELPVEIDGNVTSINLKVIHKAEKESRVAISFETPEMGKVAAEFQITEKGLKGYGICSQKEETELLSANRAGFEKRLEREEIAVEQLHFTTGEGLNLKEFSIKESKDRIPGESTKKLYRAARAFIGYIQEISLQKGNTAYENQL